MRYESSGQQTHNRSHKDYESIFTRVVLTYVETLTLPGLAASRFDGQGKRTLTPGTPSLDFKLDVQIATERVLTTPELQEEWRRLVRALIAADSTPDPSDSTDSTPDPSDSTDPTPADPTRAPVHASVAQTALAKRVILLCGRIYARRGLDRLSYFKRVKQRSE